MQITIQLKVLMLVRIFARVHTSVSVENTTDTDAKFIYYYTSRRSDLMHSKCGAKNRQSHASLMQNA